MAGNKTVSYNFDVYFIAEAAFLHAHHMHSLIGCS